MAESIIQNPSITPADFTYDPQTNYISAIAGHPLAGNGGGTIEKSDLMWKPEVGADGYVSWTLASSATQPAPAYISGAQGPAGPQGVSGNPGKNPEFQINSTNAHWEWKYSGDAEWTDLGVVASGAVGPQGLSGNNGISPKVRINSETNKWEISEDNGETWTSTNVSATGPAGEDGTNGTNGISPTVSTSAIPGGNRVIFTYDNGETTATESIDVMSGASGAKGSDGFSPTVTITDAPTATHSQGGKRVTITDKDHPDGQSFDIWNGVDGAGATVNLFEGNGIQITHEASTTNYTIGISADYSGAAIAWVNDQNYLTDSDLTDYATKAYVEAASAYAYNEAVAQIPDVTNFITKDVGDLTYYYKKTETSGATELSTEFAKYVTKPDTTQTDLNNNYLIYSTLTGAGTTTGWMPLSANYYSKTEADGRYQKKADMGSYLTTAQYETDSATFVATGDILTGTGDKLTGIKIGSTSYTVPTTDLSNYYTKSETSANGELNTEFAKKLDSTIAASTYQTKADMSAYVAVTGDQMTGELELVGSDYDNYYMKATRTGVTGHARFGMGVAGGAVIKADNGTNNAQMVLKANATSGIEILLQKNSNQDIGNLIPMVVEAAGWSPTGNDYKLHIVLDS